ncbi:MAG: family 10 glycosylhydrolase, partial [Betaproteobacteria bacterium]
MKRLIALLAALLLAACTTPPLAPAPGTLQPVLAPTVTETAPAAPREFRAAWVATVANIDWPSRPGLPVAQQQTEIVAILDRALSLKLNAILLQVRPSADAIYPSAIEPWTEYLNGAQGQGPDPWYDPLALWIAQAHQRGIELHAWINPYRARHSSAKSPVAASHISLAHPEAVKRYGESLWMDPGESAARQQTLDVVADLARRYDLDGVHIDDYFYPYPIVALAGPAAEQQSFVDVDFPDEASWQAYRAGGGDLTRADWRRRNVNQLIEAMYTLVHQHKPWLRFGISPFGLGRPGRRAPGITGFSQYDSLYADAETWLAQGWLDYLAPQLYWPIAQTPQAFATLLDSWAKGDVLARHLWPGLFTSRIDATGKSWQPLEILNQVALTRQHPGAGGHIHFSMVALLQD